MDKDLNLIKWITENVITESGGFTGIKDIYIDKNGNISAEPTFFEKNTKNDTK